MFRTSALLPAIIYAGVRKVAHINDLSTTWAARNAAQEFLGICKDHKHRSLL